MNYALIRPLEELLHEKCSTLRGELDSSRRTLVWTRTQTDKLHNQATGEWIKHAKAEEDPFTGVTVRGHWWNIRY